VLYALIRNGIVSINGYSKKSLPSIIIPMIRMAYYIDVYMNALN